LIRIGLAAVLTFCACLAFIAFANRENPSAVPTLQVQGLATAATNLAPSSTPFQGESVTLTLNTVLDTNVLSIQGRTNLPNRAILLYKVSHVAPDPVTIDGTLAVLDGQYATQVDISSLPPGTVEVWVAFQTIFGNSESQPEEIIERYGERGEYLYGENVTEESGLKRVEVRQTVEILP
jgi:hypothetical protein